MDGINGCGWCLAGGRGCWLKDPHQIPSVSWISHHSLHCHIHQIALFVPRISWSLYCYCEWWGNRKVGGGSFMLGFEWGDSGWVAFFLFSCSNFVLLLIGLSWLVHNSCCVCFLVCFLLSLSLAPLIRHYWCIEIVVLVL